MPILSGTTKWLSACSPGDLIRLPHRGTSTWAIAAAETGTPDFVSCFVAFGAADLGTVFGSGGEIHGPAVLCFGRDYRIDARHDDDGAFRPAGGLVQGNIVCCLPANGDPGRYLLCRDALDNARWLDIETGVLRGQPGGAVIDIAAWEMTLVDGRASARVVHRHNWP